MGALPPREAAVAAGGIHGMGALPPREAAVVEGRRVVGVAGDGARVVVDGGGKAALITVAVAPVVAVDGVAWLQLDCLTNLP